MTPSIQHYHGEVDISAIEVSLTHNCPHLTQDTFNLYFRTVWSWPESAGSPSAFSSTSGRGRTFLNILDAFQSSLAASHLILFILAVSLEVPHFRVFYKPLLFHLERLWSHYAYVQVSMLYGFVPSSIRGCLRISTSQQYRGRELHVILSTHSLYVGANGFV